MNLLSINTRQIYSHGSAARWWPCLLCIALFCLTFSPTSANSQKDSDAKDNYFKAKVNMTYFDASQNKWFSDSKSFVSGYYVTNGKLGPESAEVVHVLTKKNKSDGCTDIVNAPFNKSWIALIERGDCTFLEKLRNAQKFNASAVVFYNNETHKTQHGKVVYPDIGNSIDNQAVTIFISQMEGKKIVAKIEEGFTVRLDISVGEKTNFSDKDGHKETIYDSSTNNISRTSVLFVSISFIVLMIISLAWLVFYYIQRFRYAHAKERLTRRLASAAKKAIAKIPQRTLKVGDKELESEFDQCAVCIEGYKASDVIRILPCKHIFHKSCVDPWLLEQRSCPMCKLDILREYGMQVHLNSSQETVHAEAESGATASALGDDTEHLSSPEEHSRAEAIVLIRHPSSFHYHGSDTFCAETSPHTTNVMAHIELGEDTNYSDNECNELDSLMTGLPRKDSATSSDKTDV